MRLVLSQIRLKPDGMKRQRKISRRELLIGMGLLGTGTTACACAGSSLLGLWAISRVQNRQSGEIAVPATVTPSPSPRFPKPSIVSRTSWGALPPDHSSANESGFYDSSSNIEGWRVYEGDIRDAYQTVIIHHAAYYQDNDLTTLLEVQNQHRNQREWADIGYHFLVGQNGLIYEGRDFHVRGTHVEAFNTGSLGICLLGDFTRQTPTIEQLTSTLNLINWAKERLELTHIAAHRTFNPLTECPGDNLFSYMDQFVAGSGLNLGTGGYVSPEEAAACFCCSCDNIV